jgi:hypothetical protein
VRETTVSSQPVTTRDDGEKLLATLARGAPASVDEAIVTCAALYASGEAELASRIFAALRHHTPRPDALDGWPRKRLELLHELDAARPLLHAYPGFWEALARSTVAQDNEPLDEYVVQRFKKNALPNVTILDRTPLLQSAYEDALLVPRERKKIENYVKLGIILAVFLVLRVVWKLAQ